MNKNVLFLLILIASFLPFLFFMRRNNKVNLKKEIRCRQFFMPAFAALYAIVTAIFTEKISGLLLKLLGLISDLLLKLHLDSASEFVRRMISNYLVWVVLIVFNTLILLLYVIVKKIILAFFKRDKAAPDPKNRLINVFYEYNEDKNVWYIRNHHGQTRTYLKTAYCAGAAISIAAMILTCFLCKYGLITYPFYPVFAIIVIGEAAFYLDGLRKDEYETSMKFDEEQSTRTTCYAVLRKPLAELFGDKLSADGTTAEEGLGSVEDSAEDILNALDETDTHLGRNYASFIREKMNRGLKVDTDYVKSGYELANGKSKLFNTPFYYKLVPYAFYAMNRTLLDGGKVLVVLGRHGTTEDLAEWCREGMFSVSNVPDMWKIEELKDGVDKNEEMPDIGIITRTGVHNLDLHRANNAFLKKVNFVVLVEPSRLVTTAQVGLNLLVKCFDPERQVVYCSVDKNCDGLVDSLSHILMTNLTEVSATEHTHGTNSYMCWKSDMDYVQHRIVSGVSRYLGLGTELSFAALNKQVDGTVWFGGDAYPVTDQHWISRQYYYQLLHYANLPATQESFDKFFRTSFNLCDQRVTDNVYVTVEDEQNNLFEMKRIFATLAEDQGFVNVISSEYLLREYMSVNDTLFDVDAKAIPYISADFARTKRNALLVICLRLCVDGVSEARLVKELKLIGVAASDFDKELIKEKRAVVFWRELCAILCGDGKSELDDNGNCVIVRTDPQTNAKVEFFKESTLVFDRKYNEEIGKFEDTWKIDDERFRRIILQDFESASYIAEQDKEDQYLGSELKGHIIQKYLPGQFFTLNGKYYEMLSVTSGNQMLIRRASEHIKGRPAYRQVRYYKFNSFRPSGEMGTLKTVNNVDVHYQFADFEVSTPSYWKMDAYNDFKGARRIDINDVPKRVYYNKQVLKIDFSKCGENFTDGVRLTLTALFNEIFRTMFAENQAYISAVTELKYEDDGSTPLSYHIQLPESDESVEPDKAIYVIEDSQLDIGLLVAVERNLGRILEIAADYLKWNDEMIEESIRRQREEAEAPKKSKAAAKQEETADAAAEPEKKKNVFARIAGGIKGFFGKIAGLFRKKDKDAAEEEKTETGDSADAVDNGDGAPVSEGDAETTAAENGENAEPAEAAEEKAATCEGDDAQTEPEKPLDKKALKALRKEEKRRLAAEKKEAKRLAKEAKRQAKADAKAEKAKKTEDLPAEDAADVSDERETAQDADAIENDMVETADVDSAPEHNEESAEEEDVNNG